MIAEEINYEQELIADISDFYFDLYGLVMYLFPWGEKGTQLENETGPDEWQKEQLDRISEALKNGESIQEAIASGHGIGKSCEVAWIIIGLMSIRPHLNGVVTANTLKQLTDKTWKELAKWHKLAINTHWFKWTATKFSHVQHEETWFVSATPQTEHNSEAFAGLHAEFVLMIFDEASAIPDAIWDVSEGAMTTPEAVWLVYGNPTKPTGRFRDCFSGGKFSHRWKVRNIDSRTCKKTDKSKIKEWIDDYGEDSDFVRVRVKGEFPRVGTNQFIGSDVALECMQRQLEPRQFASYQKVIGVDPARFGDDRSVISIRQGGKVFPLMIYQSLDTMQLTSHVVDVYREHMPFAVYVDGIGIGAGVVDRLMQLGIPVVDVVASSASTQPREYANMRAQMWGGMREWLTNPDTDIPYDKDLQDDLTNLEYGYNAKFQIVLESKDSLKERVGKSPDTAESIAVTFCPHKPIRKAQPDLYRKHQVSNNAWT